MNAGDLRHRLLLEEPLVNQDDTGSEVVNWHRFGTVWAAIEPLRGHEQLVANQIIAEMDTRIRIRWSTNVDQVTAKWRGSHQGVIYNFQSLSHVDYGHREIEIMAQSGGANYG